MNRKVIGIDGYNQKITGEVSKTVTCAASDSDHIPLVIVYCKIRSEDENENRESSRVRESENGSILYSR